MARKGWEEVGLNGSGHVVLYSKESSKEMHIAYKCEK